MNPPADVMKALSRLGDSSDFVLFLQFLAEERRRAIADLMTSTNTVLVHQLQGSSQLLTDLVRTAVSAKPALSTQGLT